MIEEFVQYIKNYKANEVLIYENDTDTEFFCLLQGEVGIWRGIRKPGEGEECIDPFSCPADTAEGVGAPVKIGDIAEQGVYFGEMSVLLSEPRTATIIAKSGGAKVLKFPGKKLSQMMFKQPKLALRICTTLANRLRGTTTKQTETAQQRNELQDDATNLGLHAKETFQKVFVMLSSVQMHLQQPNIKSILEYMTQDKLMQGGRKIRIDEEFLRDIPNDVRDKVKQCYADVLV
jgi:CRP-like cAMP-binding protein